MRQSIVRVMIILITFSLLFSSCALPLELSPWVEQLPSHMQGLSSWVDQLPSHIEALTSLVEQLPTNIQGLSLWLGQCTSWVQQFNNQKPISYIDLIKPELANQGDTISFIGHGIDVDGEIVDWMWRSDIDGELSNGPSFQSDKLSVGEHVIYFKVQDKSGEWSAETQKVVKVLGANSDLPEIGYFSVSPSNILAGDSTTLYWNVAGATAVSIDPVIGTVALTGSRAVILETTTVFKITASNPAGSVSDSYTVTVTGENLPASPYPVINYFNAADLAIASGDISSISWSVSNANSVNIEPSIGLVAPEGFLSVCPQQSTTYTLTAANKAGSVTKAVTIGVAMELQFAVTTVQSSVKVLSGLTQCPATLEFTFNITANGAGIVTYYIESSTGVVGPTESLQFDEAGILPVSMTMVVPDSGKYWEILHIITPQKSSVQSQGFTISCVKTYGVTGASCITGPLSGKRPCPSTLFYTFMMTADGQCISRYYFEKSDGTTTPEQTITFSGAGSRTVDIEWTVYESGTYWMKLVVTSPNKVTAISQAMNLTCE
jgi:hypothetical protein